MSWGRRTSVLVALGVTAPLLTGCGGSQPQQAEPTPVVIPGSTVTIGTEPSGPVTDATTAPTTAPTTEPTSELTPEPTETTSTPAEQPRPTSSPTSSPGVRSAGRLLTKVAKAVGRYDSVHVTTTDAGVSVESDHQILAGGSDYQALVTTDGRPVELRRVGTTLYSRSGGGAFATYVEGQAAPQGDLAPAYLAWDVLGDLRTTLLSATRFEAEDPLTYRWRIPWSALEGSPNLGGTGDARVTLEVTGNGLPMRIEYADDTAPVTLTFSSWGDPVSVPAPTAG
jgi:hypothetical protein